MEEVGCDLLLFTSATAAGGRRRRIFSEDSRIRLADGCVLLGRLLTQGVTAVFFEEPADGVAIVNAAQERGLSIPADLSLLALHRRTRPHRSQELTVSRDH